jgi:4'-phosphopantetheinyl transferase
MPIVLQQQLSASVSICIWQIAETEAFFMENYQLNGIDLLEIQNIKLETRRLEKWACRAALGALTGSNTIDITYTPNGQPLFYKGFVSFSQTKDYILVAWSDQPIGVDIEKITPRILNLKHKFMNPQESISFDPKNAKDVTLIWCAKEAIYKWYAKGELDFSEDMIISKDPLRALLKKEIEISLYQMEYQDFMIVLASKI